MVRPSNVLRFLGWLVCLFLSTNGIHAQLESWVARYNDPANGADGATALAVDRQGNVHVTGYSLSTPERLEYATVKYDAGGRQQWVARYSGSEAGSHAATAIAVDGDGYV